MLVRGDHLSTKLQKEVLAQFVHRFTGEYKPEWTRRLRPDGSAYPLQFKDDKEWLANTFFHVTVRGEISRRNHYCESRPTWPNNPELRKAA